MCLLSSKLNIPVLFPTFREWWKEGGGGINRKYRFGFRILKQLYFVLFIYLNNSTPFTKKCRYIGSHGQGNNSNFNNRLVMNQTKKEKNIDSKSNTPNNLQKYVRKEISQLFLLPNSFRKLRLTRGDWIWIHVYEGVFLLKISLFWIFALPTSDDILCNTIIILHVCYDLQTSSCSLG